MKLHLIDGTYELFRNHFGAPPRKGSDGGEVGATVGLLRSLAMLLSEPGVTHVACAFDHVIESFRNDLYPGYKTGEGVERALLDQFPLAETAVAAMGVVVWPMVEFEADDALATAAARFRDEPGVEQVVICSPDKDLAHRNAQHRLRAGKQVARKKITSGPALPGKLADCVGQDPPGGASSFSWRGIRRAGAPSRRETGNFRPLCRLRGKILNTWEVEESLVLNSKEIHDISVAIGVDPGSADISGLRYGKVCILADADSDGLHIATLLCALFLRHFQPLVDGRTCVCGHAAALSDRCRQSGLLCAG